MGGRWVGGRELTSSLWCVRLRSVHAFGRGLKGEEKLISSIRLSRLLPRLLGGRMGENKKRPFIRLGISREADGGKDTPWLHSKNFVELLIVETLTHEPAYLMSGRLYNLATINSSLHHGCLWQDPHNDHIVIGPRLGMCVAESLRN